MKVKEGKYYKFNWDYQGPHHTVICKIKDHSPHHLIVDWRNYLWIGKGDSFKYSNGDAYNILEISNLTELSIEQVQQYLPDNHPDKIKISNTSSEQFYIKYNESITEEKFYQLCGILNERIGPFIEHCGIGLSYRNFISPLSSGGEGYIRTELLELGKKGWSLDNNTQGIKKQKFIEDFIPPTKYDPHSFKPIEKPKYNVGDYVITKGYSDTYDGRILKITEITTSGCKKYAYFEVIDGGEWGKSHNFRLDQIERKATQQEIDVYLKPPNEYPKNYEAWLGYIKSKTFSNLKELETIMDRSLTCDFYGVYQKIPGEWTPEKAKWVWDNILYPKTIDEVSKNIPVNSGVVITSGNTETWISGIDHYTSIGTNIPISTKDTKKTLSHQKPYIIKSPKKTSKFVRLTK